MRIGYPSGTGRRRAPPPPAEKASRPEHLWYASTRPTTRIEALLTSMTLEEKVGQMTLVSAGQAVTGPGGPVDYLPAVRAGQVGTVSNLWGPERTRAVQRIALEETRLGIPLLFVMDVIHGHRTIFPLPLAEVGAFVA